MTSIRTNYKILHYNIRGIVQTNREYDQAEHLRNQLLYCGGIRKTNSYGKYLLILYTNSSPEYYNRSTPGSG